MWKLQNVSNNRFSIRIIFNLIMHPRDFLQNMCNPFESLRNYVLSPWFRLVCLFLPRYASRQTKPLTNLSLFRNVLKIVKKDWWWTFWKVWADEPFNIRGCWCALTSLDMAPLTHGGTYVNQKNKIWFEAWFMCWAVTWLDMGNTCIACGKTVSKKGAGFTLRSDARCLRSNGRWKKTLIYLCEVWVPMMGVPLKPSTTQQWANYLQISPSGSSPKFE